MYSSKVIAARFRPQAGHLIPTTSNLSKKERFLPFPRATSMRTYTAQVGSRCLPDFTGISEEFQGCHEHCPPSEITHHCTGCVWYSRKTRKFYLKSHLTPKLYASLPTPEVSTGTLDGNQRRWPKVKSPRWTTLLGAKLPPNLERE